MSLKQSAKNNIGNVLGYGRCPVTGDTYWNSDIVSVNYNPKQGVLLSRRALTEHTPEEVARAVLEHRRTEVSYAKPMYSLEEIAAAIRSGDVMTVPQR